MARTLYTILQDDWNVHRLGLSDVKSQTASVSRKLTGFEATVMLNWVLIQVFILEFLGDIPFKDVPFFGLWQHLFTFQSKTSIQVTNIYK